MVLEKKSIDLRARYGFPTFINTFLLNQIRLADAKAAGIFSVLGIATGILFAKISGLEWTDISSTRNFIILGVALVLLVIAFKEVILVIYPRVQKSKGTSMMYFRDIAGMDKDEYISAGLKLNEEEILKNLYRQAHRYSIIVSKKYNALRIAMIGGIIALFWIIVTLLII